MSAPLCIYYRLYDLKKSVQLIVAYPGCSDESSAEAQIAYNFSSFTFEDILSTFITFGVPYVSVPVLSKNFLITIFS